MFVLPQANTSALENTLGSVRPRIQREESVEKMNSDASVSGFEYSDDAFDPVELVTNDAVGSEPVKPTGNYAGPEGSEPSRRLPSTRSTHPTQKTARTTWMASSRNASGPASSFGHGASERTDSRGSIGSS